ncbi:hypothetical protein ACHQM5_002087 [Ranunculus cassubicifolius]
MMKDSKSNVVKPNNNNQIGNPSSKGKVIPSINKKTTTTTKQSFDSKHKSLTSVVKSEGRDKGSSSSSKTVTKTTTVKVKSQKKVYTLPGQKYDPPEEREPLRIFYESLSNQIPSSEMAAFWMMEHGLLSPDRAKKAYERKQKRQQQQRAGTPNKSLPKLNSKPESSQKPQAVSKNGGDFKGKKKVVNESDDDDEEFIVKRQKR